MTPQVFREMQNNIGFNNEELARLLGVTVLTVTRWRTGWTPISGPAALAMTALDAGWRPGHTINIRRRSNDDVPKRTRKTNRLRRTDREHHSGPEATD